MSITECCDLHLINMKSIILISTLALVHCMPSNLPPSENKPSVEDTEKPVKVTNLPFYGGAKGQTLQIIEKPDGTVTTVIIQSPLPLPSTETPIEKVTNLTALEYPQLPTKYESEFGYNIKNLQRTALNIIKLQEAAKNHGSLNDDEQIEYARNMDTLNLSAKNLAQIQENDDEIEEDDAGLTAWFDRQKKREEMKKKEEEEKKKKKEDDKKKKEEDKKKQEANKEKEKEKEKEEEEEEEEEDENDDSVVVNLPPDDASVAEAKPVGLAVAGVGGVAASKPIATAVVGPGGLAIARPVGTAIAGVAPDQALIPIFAESYMKPSKKEPPKEGKPKYNEASKLLTRIISKYHEV